MPVKISAELQEKLESMARWGIVTGPKMHPDEIYIVAIFKNLDAAEARLAELQYALGDSPRVFHNNYRNMIHDNYRIEPLRVV